MNDKDENKIFRTSIGGQALIEGIMMRGPEKQSIVIRDPEGELVEKIDGINTAVKKYPILAIPFIRGVAGFLGSMIMGVKALMYSSQFMPEEEQEEPGKIDKWIEQKFGWEKAEKYIIGFSVAIAVVVMVALFILLPTFIAGLFDPFELPNIARNLIEGAIKIIIFICYLFIISKTKDIHRVFQYHGAEHKSIHCYEKGLELTVKNVRIQPRQHPRCGTSFLFVVIIVSIILVSFVSWTNVWIRMLVRIALLPVTVAISYEINRWVGRHDNALSAILSAPGKAMQYLTTFEPDDSMIEVGIKALKLVIPDVKGADTW